MSAFVDYNWYASVYMGSEADTTSFPALYAHASRIIGAMTRWKVTEDSFLKLAEIVKTQYRLAICSEIDFLAINGMDSINGDDGGGGFTVGKVTVHGKGNSSGKGGAMSEYVSPAARMYLEQTGLMHPGVGVFPC